MIFVQFLRLLSLIISLQLPMVIKAQQTAATKYFINKTQIQIKPFSLQTARNGKLSTSDLEQFRDLFASTKYFLTQQFHRDFKLNYKFNIDMGKLQPQYSSDKPFPCATNNTRSVEVPLSVHKLRPGDIDIIGAMGDSLTAGTGMMSRTLTELLVEFRGQTTLGGGLKDWRSFLTLPNILKVFNPNLYGHAVANTLAKNRLAHFNVAEPFAITQDMPYMAEVLIRRLQTDAKVNMTHHWKMISIFIASNDVCNDVCYYDKAADFLLGHRKDLYRTLTILKQNIPRLIINLIIVPEIDTILRSMKNIPAYCQALHKASCHCLIGDTINSKLIRERHEIIQQIQKIQIELASLPEFQLEEFAVVPRTFAVNKTLKMLKNGNTNWKMFAIDCFHFSQYGNAALTNMLWNNMLQVKTKPTNLFPRPFENIACPTAELPFISTLKNS